jgi:hypothetical protein
MTDSTEEKFTCDKCGKEKEKVEGAYTELDEKTFCCDNCCKKEESDDDKPKICEFC